MITFLRRRPWITVAAVCELLLLVWWLGQFPGLVSPDSASYTWGITHGYWSLGGSVSYDALEWLSLQMTGGVAALVLLQLTVFAVAVTLVARGVHRCGVRGRYAAAAAVAVCAAPMTGAFVIFVSKDMLFVAGQLLCLAGLLELLLAEQASARRSLALLVSGAVTMTLCRQNGVEMLAVATFIVVLLVRRAWRPMLTATGVATLMWAVVTFGLAPAAGAHPADSSLVLGPAYGDIGVVYREDPKLFSPGEAALMAKVAPLSFWATSQGCYSSDGLTKGDFVGRADPVHTALARLWLRLLERAPGLVLRARLCRGAIAWDPFPVALHTVLPPLATPTNLYGWRPHLSPSVAQAVSPASPIPAWHRAENAVLHATTVRGLQFLLWRGATWSYLAYLAVAVAAIRRRQRALLAVTAFILANQVVVLVDNPNQLARYMLGCLFSGVLLLPIMAARSRPTAGSDPDLDPPNPGSDHELPLQLAVDAGSEQALRA